MDYYSALKRKEVLTHATPRRKLDDVLLRKPVTKKTNTVRYHLYDVSRAVKFIKQKVERWLPESERRRK